MNCRSLVEHKIKLMKVRYALAWRH